LSKHRLKKIQRFRLIVNNQYPNVLERFRRRKPVVVAGLRACTVVAVVIGLSSPLRAASLFDPLFRFRTLPTEHFVIYFHQDEDRLAQGRGRRPRSTPRPLACAAA
jgi:hypothetical protein